MNVIWWMRILICVGILIGVQEAAWSQGKAVEHPIGRVYDLSWIFSEFDPERAFKIRPHAGGLLLEEESRPGDWDDGESPLAFERDSIPFYRAHLVDRIRAEIHPASWGIEAHSLEFDKDELNVVNLPVVQDAIRTFLSDLETAYRPRFTLEIAIVPLEHVSQRGRLTLEEFDATVSRAGSKARRFLLNARSGNVVRARSGALRRAALETEINQTGVMPVANTYIRALELGDWLEVLPRALPGSDRVEVQLRWAHNFEYAPAEKRESIFADIELLRLAESSLETNLLLVPGYAAVAGTLEWRGKIEESLAVLIKIRNRGEALRLASKKRLEVVDPMGRFWRRYDLGAIEFRERFTSDLVSEFEDTSDYELNREQMHVRATARRHEEIATRLRQTNFTTIEMRFETWEGDLIDVLALQDLTSGEPWLPEGWRKNDVMQALKLLAAASAQVRSGSSFTARCLRTRGLVTDLSVVSGGAMSFAIVEIPAEVVSYAGDGFTLNARVSANAGRLTATGIWKQARMTSVDSMTAFAAVPTRPADQKFRRAISNQAPFKLDVADQESSVCAFSSSWKTGSSRVLRVEQAAGGRARILIASASSTVAEEGGER